VWEIFREQRTRDESASIQGPRDQLEVEDGIQRVEMKVKIKSAFGRRGGRERGGGGGADDTEGILNNQ
jgi:hypothetical protein